MLIQNIDVMLLTIFHLQYVLSPYHLFQLLPNGSEADKDNTDGKMLILRKALFQYWGTFVQSFCHQLVLSLTRSWGTKPLENKYTYINYIWFDVFSHSTNFRIWYIIMMLTCMSIVDQLSFEVLKWNIELVNTTSIIRSYNYNFLPKFLYLSNRKHTKLYCPLK